MTKKPTYKELEQRISELEELLAKSKQDKEALRDSEKLYRWLFDHSSDGILIVDHATGRFLNFNETAHLQLGYSYDEFSKLTIFDVETAQTPEEIQSHFEQLEQHGKSEFETMHHTKQGEIKHIHVIIQYIKILGRPVHYTIWHDITARKQAEKALRDSEERYRSLVETTTDWVWEVDHNGVYIYSSPKVKEVLGYEPEEIIGKTPFDLMPPEEAQRVAILFADIVKHCKPIVNIENTNLSKDGRQVVLETSGIPIFDMNGNLLKYRGIDRDITKRKYAEQELVWNSALLEAQVEATLDGILIVDSSGHTILTNQRFFDIWKVPQYIRDNEDDTPLLQYAMSLTKYPEKFFKRIMYLYDHQDETSRDEIELNDGTVVDRYSSPVLSKDGKYYGRIWTFRDVTGHKQAENTLKRSEYLYRAIFENTSTANMLVNVDTKIILVNSEFEKLSGYSKEEVEGKKSWTEFVVEEDFNRLIQYHLLRSNGNSTIPQKYEFRLKDRHGNVRDISISVNMIPSSKESIASLHDITERKQAEKTLQESQRRMADIIEFLPDATFIIEDEGKIIAWNRAMEIMTGIKKENMLGKGDYEYALPFYGQRRPMIIDLALHPNKETEKQYTAIQRMEDILFGESFTPNLPPGDIHLSATASVLRNEKGEITAAIECIRDNTERKKLEEHLKRLEKMESLGTLAGGVAHDLNNVLGVLVGYSELLAESLPEDSFTKKCATNILNSGMKGSAIIQDLLTLARRGVNISEVVDLNKVVMEYFRSPEFEKLKSYHPNVTIKTKLDNELLYVKGSPIHLGKTIMNLISNAAEAISDKGKVIVRTENRYLDYPVNGYGTIQEGDYAVLSVSDTGDGIPAHDLAKIFEPFYTKKVMGRSGTGLGLAVVWGTVKDHNGYIDVKSEEDKGSIFTLYFPITREKPAKTEKTDPRLTYKGKGESILVVDDVKEQRELAINMLGILGYQVEAVAGGEEAVEYLKNKKADLIVLDMIMDPGIDGMETYQRILDINPKQKAIIVSGFSETARVKKAQEIGAGAFVRKPYILEKIGLAVRNELDRKQK